MNETMNMMKDWPLKACRSLITKSLQFLTNPKFLQLLNHPPPPLHLWVNVFQISTNNKSRVSQRNLRFGFRLQSEMKIHTWDSPTCQSMGYGTQMTVRACGPLVYYIYICILLTEKYSPRLIFIPFALIVREKFKIRWKQMLQTTSFEHKCVWVNSKMWQVKKGEKYSGWK